MRRLVMVAGVVLDMLGVLILANAKDLIDVTNGAGGSLSVPLIAGTLLLAGIVLSSLGWLLKASVDQDERLLVYGRPRMATVFEVRHSRLWVNGDPTAFVELEIDDRGTPVTASCRMVIPQEELDRVAFGGRLPVRIDAQDPTKFVVDWECLRLGQKGAGETFGMTPVAGGIGG